MDRAWVAMRELLDVPELSVEAHRLTARMFLLRGWPKRARTSLQKALADAPEDKELNRLWEESEKPPPEIPDEEPATPKAALEQAEMRLARGEVLRAQRLLEMVRREDDDNQRALDLLWGLAGDFDLGGTIAELVERLGPSVGQLADLADDSEHTESITAEENWEDEEAGADPRFPFLFRESGDPVTEEYEDGEVTQTRLMASTQEMLPLDALAELPEPSGGDGGDTQILRVIEHGVVQRTPGETMHKDVRLPDEGFDLDAYRREMGVLDDLLSNSSSDLEPLETEDNDVIVFTRREMSDSFQGLEPDPSEDTMSHPDARRFLSEEARAAADKEFMARARALAELEKRSAADEITVTEARPELPRERTPTRPRRDVDFLTRHAGAFAAIVVALLLAILVLVFAIGLRIFQS
ncbi:MAG: hypothetical protein EP330_24455 [Deltaproteobacteria bacterium]|nr:MAG: hypothetical protein EP330_24455 [Deltaproteobacteria bacterium]